MIGVKAMMTALASLMGISYYFSNKNGYWHDLRMLVKVAPAKLRISRHIGRGESIIDVFEQSVAKWPDHEAIMYNDISLSFSELDKTTNQVAQWGLSQGLKPHDVVALYMENRPEFVSIWVGLAKIGVVTAFINTHIAQDSLLHCLKVSDAKIIIYGSELSDKVKDIQSDVDLTFFIHHEFETQGVEAQGAYDLNEILAKASTERPDQEIRSSAVTTEDTALMIYTSGTTGMPKAAKMLHSAILSRAITFAQSTDVTRKDRLYCALPLYHTAGGLLAIGMMMTDGLTTVIARRFSKSKLLDQVRKYNCTILQYIGEFCRYLMTVPESTDDAVNPLRLAVGNGLRPDIWKRFQDRFDIPTVVEFYGSTEGPGGLLNICSSEFCQGNLGATGPLTEKITGLKLIQYDIDTDEHVRDANGNLIECAPGSPAAEKSGELLIRIQNQPGMTFAGYHGNKKATQKKILTDVFQSGDMYMRTGDLFKRDAQRRWYFVDRIGDTFRWKGENVATSEVAEAISQFPGLEEINVYGVAVPGHDGRACMAAMIFDKHQMDFTTFATFVGQKLPAYARPLFIRKLSAMQVTGTFKHQKSTLRNQGMDPSLVGDDEMWFWNGKRYTPLTLDTYEDVLNARL